LDGARASVVEALVLSLVCYLVAFALLCVSVALVLWQRAAQTQNRVSTVRFVDSRIGAAQANISPSGGAIASAPAGSAATWAGAGAGVGSAGGSASSTMAGASDARAQQILDAQQQQRSRGPAAAALRKRGASAFERHMIGLRDTIADHAGRLAHRAGVRDIGRFYLLSTLGLGVLALLVMVRSGPIAAVVLMVLALLGMRIWLWNRATRRQHRIVRQLPAFLDGVVRLITIGSSLPAAFQAAAPASDLPLRDCLERASRMMRAGVEIDKALFQLSELYRVQEFMLVAAIVRLSVKYGGRADLVLERMAAFIRDREMAERELLALSAETRLSAWILGLLPVTIGSFIIFTNPAYFLGMWHDPTGRHLLYGAFGLQTFGVFLLFRLAKL
jgi:tight adherence protein B